MTDHIEDILKIGFFILVAVVQLVVRLTKDKGDSAEAKASPDTHLAQWLLRARDMLDDAHLRLAALQGEVALLVEKRPSGPDGARLTTAAHRLKTELAGALTTFERAQQLTKDGRNKAELATLANGQGLRAAFSRLETQPEQVKALAAVFAMHERTAERDDLERWRRFAQDALAPVWQFASDRGLKIPEDAPLFVPAEVPRAALRELFPGVSLVGLDLADHGPEQAFDVARDLSRILIAKLPDLGAWVAGEAPVVHPRLPAATARGVTVDVQDLVRAWLPDVVIDALAAAMLGPAAMTAMVRRLGSLHQPEAVVSAGASQGRLTHMAPADFRVRVMARTLTRLGHVEHLAAQLRHWDQMHDHPEALLIPMADGRRARVAPGAFVDVAQGVVEALLSDQCQVVGGYPLSAVLGFVLSPSMVAHVAPQLRRMAGGHPVVLSARLKMMAVIEAIAAQPADRARILDAFRRDASEESEGPRVEHLTGRPTVKDAMVVRMILARPGGRYAEQSRL